MRFATKAIHAGLEPDPTTGAIMTPVYLTSTYAQSAPGQHKGYEYSRSDHPTRAALECNLAALEGVDYGLAFASGLAAENTVLNLLQPGDHVVATRDLYGGTYRLFERVWAKYGIEFSYADGEDIDALRQAFRPNTKLLWIETPSNPMLTITDLKAACGDAPAVTYSDIYNLFKPSYLPGTVLRVRIIKKGKEKDEGIGHLEGGVKVVVENAAAAVGSDLEVVVLGTLDTDVGQVVFARPRFTEVR